MSPHPKQLEVECPEDCGNSPKKKFLREFIVALAKNDIEFCTEWVKEDVVWEIAGGKKIQGKEEFAQALQNAVFQKIGRLSIENIITHGNAGSVNGRGFYSDERSAAFCHVFQFSGFGKKAKIKSMTSYIIFSD